MAALCLHQMREAGLQHLSYWLRRQVMDAVDLSSGRTHEEDEKTGHIEFVETFTAVYDAVKLAYTGISTYSAIFRLAQGI
jgi:hypothetical protein